MPNRELVPTEKPIWDLGVSGTHPAFFTPATQEEIQSAMNLRRFLSPKALWVEDNKQAVRSNEILLAAAIESELGIKVINAYREALASSLASLGEFDAARERVTILRKGKRVAMSNMGSILTRIARLEEAVNAPNGYDCGCERPRTTIPDNNGKDVEIELPRRQNVGWVFDKAQGKVLTVWECQVVKPNGEKCGDLNAYDDVPESQREFRDAKTNAQAQMLNLQRKGVEVTAQSFDMSKAISDIDMFAVK